MTCQLREQTRRLGSQAWEDLSVPPETGVTSPLSLQVESS
jgi:hypothetical protein